MLFKQIKVGPMQNFSYIIGGNGEAAEGPNQRDRKEVKRSEFPKWKWTL